MKHLSVFQLCLACILLVLSPGWASAAPTTEIIPLSHGTADDMLPAIQPLLRHDERVSAYGNQLIIRAEPERLQEIRALLADLDRRPAQLRISVATAGTRTGSQSGYHVDGRIRTGVGDVVIGQPRGSNRAGVIRRETTGASDGVRVIVANEGYPVLIQTGQSIPLDTFSSNVYGQVMRQTEYHDVTAGFYATVRLSGDLATITLSANNNRLSSSAPGVIDVQRTDTVVNARLGEWVTIGGVDDYDDSQDRDIGRRTTTRSAQQQSVRVMVERAD